MSLNRRRFIASGSCALSFASTLPSALGAVDQTHKQPALIPDKNRLLDLPEGFRYSIIDRMGQLMDDGYVSPGLPDGMACFDIGDNKLALMRNHELQPSQKRFSAVFPSKKMPEESYDKNSYGSVSRIVFDKTSLQVLRKNLVLLGTDINCSGGPSPWGWLSCEETTVPNHGYVFLCDPKADTIQKPERKDCYGRFRHEAVCIDPDTSIAYLTEDMTDASFYRMVPKDKKKPFEGVFQALSIKDQPKMTTTHAMKPGISVEVNWVDIEDPTPKDDSVRYQAQKKGAAIFARCEGIWRHDKSVYFCATIGGPKERGQIFKLDIGPRGNDRLTLVAQADHSNDLDMPDNITVSSWGDAYLAEDGEGANFIRVMKPDGKILDFAKNVGAASEFCGVCFTPDENTLFVNLQNIHATLMIQGPFQKFGILQS